MKKHALVLNYNVVKSEIPNIEKEKPPSLDSFSLLLLVLLTFIVLLIDKI